VDFFFADSYPSEFTMRSFGSFSIGYAMVVNS